MKELALPICLEAPQGSSYFYTKETMLLFLASY